jgi:hypothetical protein
MHFEMLKFALCGINVHVWYLEEHVSFSGGNLVLFHVNKIQHSWSRGSTSQKHQNVVIALQGLNTQSKTYCKNLRTKNFTWFVVCGTINVTVLKCSPLLQHSYPHFAGALPVCAVHCCSIHILTLLGPSQCVLSISAAFTSSLCWGPPSVCCPLLQHSHPLIKCGKY